MHPDGFQHNRLRIVNQGCWISDPKQSSRTTLISELKENLSLVLFLLGPNGIAFHHFRLNQNRTYQIYRRRHFRQQTNDGSFSLFGRDYQFAPMPAMGR